MNKPECYNILNVKWLSLKKKYNKIRVKYANQNGEIKQNALASETHNRWEQTTLHIQTSLF